MVLPLLLPFAEAVLKSYTEETGYWITYPPTTFELTESYHFFILERLSLLDLGGINTHGI